MLSDWHAEGAKKLIESYEMTIDCDLMNFQNHLMRNFVTWMQVSPRVENGYT